VLEFEGANERDIGGGGITPADNGPATVVVGGVIAWLASE
jgi:hypothetical protein